ncbi:hypothetical protein ACF0H5_021633 [Mactra antiquata]
MEDRGEVLSMKFSPDRRVLAIQRSQKSVLNLEKRVLKNVKSLNISIVCNKNILCWKEFIAKIYGQIYIIVLRHLPRPGASGAEVVLYQIPQQKEAPAKKTNDIEWHAGCLWHVELMLEPLVTMISDKCRLIKLLLQRWNSKGLILDVFKQMLLPGQQARLPVISRIVDMLNQGYKTNLEAEMVALSKGYKRSQACLMLSLESVYPPAHQLALDMLTRLATANEEIIEVLLSTCCEVNIHMLLLLIVLGLRKKFIRRAGITDTVSSRKFLEAATCMNTSDNQLFYTVFKFFQQRNIRMRGSPVFQPGELCEMYVKYFEQLFGSDALTLVLNVS